MCYRDITQSISKLTCYCALYSRYWQLPLEKVPNVNCKEVWDRGVHDASEEYKGRMVGAFSVLTLLVLEMEYSGFGGQ